MCLCLFNNILQQVGPKRLIPFSFIMKTIFRLFALCLSLAACLSLYAETNKTLLRIDGNDISVDEFTYYFQRSAQNKDRPQNSTFPASLTLS